MSSSCGDPVIKSAKEMEDGIFSTPTVKWDPFTVFPKEIYLKIFNKLDNPTDKQNFMNAHVKFYDLFKEERVKFLFGKVFGDLTPDEKEKTENNLTRLRLVCREWDQGIQNYYQLHPDHFKFWFCQDNEWGNDSDHLKTQFVSGYYVMWNRFRLRDQEGYPYISSGRNLWTDMAKFVESHPSKNPFLTRKINIDISWRRNLSSFDQDLRNLFNQVGILLETYGKHIWHFRFNARWLLDPETYSMIVQWLRLMPELRTLQIWFHDAVTEGTSGEPDQDETKLLKSILEIEPPKLMKLKNLHFSNFPNFAFNKLLEGMPDIEKVEVISPPQPGFQFPESIIEAGLRLWKGEDIKDLGALEQSPVLLNLNAELLGFSWETVLMGIGEKFPALEYLHLSLPWVMDKRQAMEQSLDCRLNLKKLKRLSLTFPTLSSLDFLQEIKTLEELEIDLLFLLNEGFPGSDGLVRRQRVQFNTEYLDYIPRFKETSCS